MGSCLVRVSSVKDYFWDGSRKTQDEHVERDLVVLRQRQESLGIKEVSHVDTVLLLQEWQIMSEQTVLVELN